MSRTLNYTPLNQWYIQLVDKSTGEILLGRPLVYSQKVAIFRGEESVSQEIRLGRRRVFKRFKVYNFVIDDLENYCFLFYDSTIDPVSLWP